MRKWPYLTISLLVVILDQLSKFLVKIYIKPGEIIKITDKFFWLTRVQNHGAAFSISFGNNIINRIFFIVFSIIVLFFIIYLMKKTNSHLEIAAFSLILGGAIGNLVDRILIGSVTDFIWWDFPDIIMHRWPVFNIADSAIVIAICLLLIEIVFSQKKNTEEI